MSKNVFFSGVLTGIAAVLMINAIYTSISNEQRIFSEAKINQIVEILETHHVNDICRASLEEGIYTGLVHGVNDPYTSYMSREAYQSFLQQTEGKFAGLGISVFVDRTDDSIVVQRTFRGFPGERAGILRGDKIIEVDGTPVTGVKLEEAVRMMQGPPGTSVNVRIRRESTNSTFDLEITRETIEVPTIDYRIVDNNIGYIRISGFERVTYDQFVTALESLQQSGVNSLIIDLRGNPGGLLDVVVNIADRVLPQGIITYTEDRHGNRRNHYSGVDRVEVPMAVLVNGGSASASEVLAGAIKDTNTGTLIGTQTFGKGVVQNLYTLPDGSAVKVTMATYFTPNGVNINQVGIEPDYIIDLDMELLRTYDFLEDIPEDKDDQLQKAIEVLNREQRTGNR